MQRVHLPTPGCKGLSETLYPKAGRVTPTNPAPGLQSCCPCHMLFHGTNTKRESFDVKNAFNSIRRDTVLQAPQTHLPKIYPFIWDCYSSKTFLFHREFCLDSATGVQQRNPLSLTLFALAIHRGTGGV